MRLGVSHLVPFRRDSTARKRRYQIVLESTSSITSIGVA